MNSDGCPPCEWPQTANWVPACVRQIVGGADDVERVHGLGLADQVRVWPRRAEPLVVAGGHNVARGQQLTAALEQQRLPFLVRDQRRGGEGAA